MDDIEEQLELQKLNEQNEVAMKKLKEANVKLQNIQKQCNESKIIDCNLKSELEVLDSKELTLKEAISSKIEKEKLLQADCEQTVKELGKVSWQRKIIAVKLELEMNNRKRYENMMKTGIKPAIFLEIDSPEKRRQKMEDLISKIDLLKREIAEKRKLNDEFDKSYLETQKSNKEHIKTMQEIKKNLENVEILIDQQEEELQRLSNNSATNL